MFGSRKKKIIALQTENAILRAGIAEMDKLFAEMISEMMDMEMQSLRRLTPSMN